MMPNMNWEDHTIEPIDTSKKPSITIDKVSIAKECVLLSDLLIKKNRDYGNSVQEQFEEYGLTSILIRLDDKLRRLKNLLSNPQLVKDESVLDTMNDLAGYAVLGSLCLQIDKEKNPVLNKHKYFDADDQY
jgi:hypothetical protein